MLHDLQNCIGDILRRDAPLADANARSNENVLLPPPTSENNYLAPTGTAMPTTVSRKKQKVEDRKHSLLGTTRDL
jgi:hypothetical protein